MSFTIGSYNIADTRIQGVSIRPVVGAYELVFDLYLTIHPANKVPSQAKIAGARVSVKPTGQKPRDLGYARPEQHFEIRQYESQSSMTPALTMLLQPNQLAALETMRGTSDLDFELLASGIGFDSMGDHQVQDTWRVHVPRSEWITNLRGANARNVLLLEVPMPLGAPSEEWEEIAHDLQRAEEQFRIGDYHACVSSCRTVVQELGFLRFKNRDWAGPVLNRLASDRNGMTKDERESGLWSSLRHYTHQAHHGDSEGGVSHYSRADAQLVLTMTASFVAHLQVDGKLGGHE